MKRSTRPRTTRSSAAANASTRDISPNDIQTVCDPMRGSGFERLPRQLRTVPSWIGTKARRRGKIRPPEFATSVALRRVFPTHMRIALNARRFPPPTG